VKKSSSIGACTSPSPWRQTIRDNERLNKLAEGSCDLNDVNGIIERIVAVSGWR
jgi:hypothetical protein